MRILEFLEIKKTPGRGSLPAFFLFPKNGLVIVVKTISKSKNQFAALHYLLDGHKTQLIFTIQKPDFNFYNGHHFKQNCKNKQ